MFAYRKLFFLMSACAAMSAHASVVPVDNAKLIASEFFNASGREAVPSGEPELVYTSGTKTRPLYYVFNAGGGHGYVIVSADDCTATPILGYSSEGCYDAASVPAAMKWMLSGIEREIKAAPSVQKSTAYAERRRVARRTAQSNERILLNTAQWSQEGPFNSKIPGRPLVGCVGTAMSIIMKYHNYPSQGTGSYNGVNFNVTYDWDNMRVDNYRYEYSTEEADAVSTLIYHAASSIGTLFGMSGSSAYEVRVPAALVNYFGYNPGISFKKRSETATQEQFDHIVINEIKARRPVLYCGQDVTTGHAFVVDGYDPGSNMIHVNWGWAGADGNNNGGWYVTTALNPVVSQNHNFNNLTTVIYNIKPGSGDNSAWSPIHITADGGQPGMGSDITSLSPGKKFTVRVGNLKNLNYNKFSGRIAVALFDVAGKFKAVLGNTYGFNLEGMATLGSGYSDFRDCALPDGVTVAEGDMIRIATSVDNGSTWLPVPGELITINEIPASRTEADCFAVKYPASVAGAKFEGSDKVIRGWNYTFKVTPDNPSEDVVTVKANGYILTPTSGDNYAINNVKEDQVISIVVQKASEVKEKRSIWVGEAGTLESLISDVDAGVIKDLTLFGTIDARDFEFMRGGMNLTRLDISAVNIAAYAANQANAIPRSAFQGKGSLKTILLPGNINRINNAAFRQCGITSITIPAGVSTYEYNVFLNASSLRDIWVGREKAEFINWCVLTGTNKGAMTLHVPNERAKANYQAKEYWQDISNIVVDPIPAKNDFAFAVMEDNRVKYESDATAGRLAKGTKVTFTAEYVEQSDERMDVYANSTLLTPDAQGVYSLTVDNNTIVHFDFIKPIPVEQYASPWQLTDTGGTVGLLTDAVNVIPGVNFTIRANALYVPAEYASMFWAAVLTDADGNIKEFISPVSVWPNNISGDGLKMNINCCVKESSVREGNFVRLATSYNKKKWRLVEGRNDEVVDALPALNNQTPVYNINIPDLPNANVTGKVATAVRGRDITVKVTPKSAGNRVRMLVNGTPVADNAPSVSYSFIAKRDMDFDIEVYSPNIVEEVVYEIKPGEHLYYGDAAHAAQDRETLGRIRSKVVVVGDIDNTDFGLFKELQAQRTVISLDLSQARIVQDRTNSYYKADEFPANAFCRSSAIGTVVVNLQELKLPPTVKQIQASAFYQCSKIKELELPKDLYNREGSGWWDWKGGLGMNCFDGCTSLTTLYVPCEPKGDMVHHISSMNNNGINNLGLADPTKVTVVVNPEYLETYKTPHDIGYNGWINMWVKNGFNIVGEYPVYSLNYDPTRCFIGDKNFNINGISFLGNNVATESITVADKLFVSVHSPEGANSKPAEGTDAYDASRKTRIYDNGKLLKVSVGGNGSVPVTFWNPNKHADKSGNHEIKVVYLYDVKFDCASSLFVVTPEEIRNNENELGDEATAFEQFNYYQADAPVLENVTEGAVVRFSLKMNTANSGIKPRVKVGEQVVEADEDGMYSVPVTDSDVKVEVFAVPDNGATLSDEELGSINMEETVGVTSISLEGDITPESLANVVSGFESLEELDLSGMNGTVPAGAFENKETLTTVTLPAVESVEENTFKGCSSLTTVTLPESVSTIGAGAFNGCSSLETITLTGVDAVGEGAFDGCDNMTSINLNPAASSSPASVRRNAKATGFDSNAFAGLNPNCIIVVGEGVAVPQAKANYVKTRTGEIDDADADGNPIKREGRIYESAGDMSLRPGYPFAPANAFSMIDGDVISYRDELKAGVSGSGNWTSLVVPFDVDKVADADGKELVQKTSPADSNADYMVAGVGESDSGFELKPVIKANTPYIVKQCEGRPARAIAFSATGVKVSPAVAEDKGVEFALAAGYRDADVPLGTAYLINEAGDAFVKALVEDEIPTVAVRPFEVYAVSDDGRTGIEIKVEGETSSIGDVELPDEGLAFSREGNDLVIYSDKAVEIEVYGIEGRLVKTISLVAGRNAISGIERGIYVIAGHKVVI